MSLAGAGAQPSLDPKTWKCFPCPEGSSCAGNIAWDGVIALFGYWRVPGPAPNEFIACPFPGACLGAPNVKFEGKYLNESEDGTQDGIDYAMHRFAEGCNTYFGFRPGSRLCHTCLDEFRRQGQDRCSKCPLEGQNYGLMALAVLLVVCGGVVVVWMAIKDAGNAGESEIIRKVNFLSCHLVTFSLCCEICRSVFVQCGFILLLRGRLTFFFFFLFFVFPLPDHV